MQCYVHWLQAARHYAAGMQLPTTVAFGIACLGGSHMAYWGVLVGDGVDSGYGLPSGKTWRGVL